MAIIRYIWALNPGATTGTPALFIAPTSVAGSASYSQEQTNLTGAAGAVVTIQVTSYNNSSNTFGQVLVNSSQVFLNTTFTVTLDGTGAGSFTSRLQGDPTQTGTTVLVTFTITGVSTGQTGTPSSHQISKSF